MHHTDKIDAFRRLHAHGCFVLPNPWDAGSAKILTSLEFSALATTSAGHAFSLGREDDPTTLGLDDVLEHIRAIVAATDLPINADFQAGYGTNQEQVGLSVAQCIATGVAGLSIEDATGDPANPLFAKADAVARVRAAKTAIDESGLPVVLTARAECFLVGHPKPLSESIDRLIAYAEAGADCLYAPGLRTPEQITEVVNAIGDLPLNVLTVDPSWMTVQALADLGVRRISVGSAMARVALGAFLRSAQAIATDGTFESLSGAEPFQTFTEFFGPSR